MTSNLRDQLQATLSGTHTLERELGGGGMSKVFVANEVRLKRKVVVKVLSPELAQGISVERFEREIQTAAALQQANIVPVLSAGDTNGLPFYTMPFVEGESLRSRLARGPLGVTEVIGVLRDVSKALAYAHRQGVVHRDIKPDNVLLSEGTAVVTDFGIAKAISAARTASGGATLTQIGTSIGTPAYMAPEQAAGDPQIDHRADIYSLGAMAYELLTGQAVFANRTPQRMLAAHMSEAPAPITQFRADLPPALADLVMQCLAKEAGARPQNAADLARVLESITSGSGMQSLPPVLLGGPGMLKKALAIYAGAFAVVAILAKAAIVGIGLPDWVFPGSLIVMALGLPVVLWTAYVQHVARRAFTATPTFTPGGSPSTTAHGTMATMALKAAPHVSWYRTARGGMYAFGTFIVAIAGFMILRAFGIGPAGSLIGKGAFGAKETIVVADFTSPRNDSTLGATAAEALRTDLAQSKNLKVLTKAAVAEVLRLMQRPTDTDVRFALAREVASREGAKAVLDGDISEIGGTYVIAARLVGALDGAELAQFRRTAKGQADVVEALGELSKDIRSKVGESLRNVNESLPLERVSTSSLPALRKYVEAVQLISTTGDNARGRALLMQAVELDSTFAMAWRRIAASYSGSFQQEGPSVEAIRKAFRYRDRLSETERLLTDAYYYSSGAAPDRERAIAAYEALIERDSLNRSALNNVGILYGGKRDFTRAEEMYRRAVAVAQPFGGSFFGLMGTQLLLGKIAAAESTEADFAKRLPSHGGRSTAKAVLAIGKGRLDEADSIMRASYASARDAEARTDAASVVAGIASLHGQMREAQRWTARAIPDSNSVPAGTLSQMRLSVMIDSAWAEAYHRRNPAAAKAIVGRALQRIPMERIAPADRPWFAILRLAAVTQDAPAAQAAKAAMDRDYANSNVRMIRGFNEATRAFVALAQKQPAEAASLLAEADKGDLGSRELGPWRGFAFEMAGQPDSAIAEIERYLTFPDPFLDPFVASRDHWAVSHERLGGLYEARGQPDKAAEHYRQFVEMWKGADSDLQPRVTAARERLARLATVERPKR